MRRTVALLVLALGVPPARADVLALKDGRFVEGVKVQQVEGGYKLLYKNGEVFVPVSMVQECLIEGEKGYEPRSEEERAKLEKGLVPFEGRWVPKGERDSLVAKRRTEKKKKIEERKAHREWRNRYTSKSTNFEFEYTIDPEVFENLKNMMETYYTVFTKKWGISRPNKLGRLKVCFYHDYDSFLQVGGAGWGVLGYFRFIDPLELNFFYERIDPDFTIWVMFHETNHYLTHLIDPDFDYPHNINEPFAEYYGASRWDPVKKEMSVGHVLEGRLTEVLTDIQGGEWKGLEDYLRDKLGYDNYTWGWSFVHFMMETPKYAPKFKSFYLGLARDPAIPRIQHMGDRRTVSGEEMLKAFQRYLGVKDLKPLEKEWHEYIKTKLKLETHRGYEQAAMAAQSTGQNVKARRFFKLAIEKGSTNPTVYRRYAASLRHEGKDSEAAQMLRKAIELGPLEAELYAELGAALRGLKDPKNKDEGKRLFALAKEMDPDNIEIAYLEAVEEVTKETGKRKP